MGHTTLSCWIIVNGSLQSSKFTEQAIFLKDAAERSNIKVRIIKNSELLPILRNGFPTLFSLQNFSKPDFVLFMDKDIHLARHLEQMGFLILNSASAIEICDNKIKTHQALVHTGIPMPETIYGPFLFDGFARDSIEPLLAGATQLHYPFVLKEAYGSFGQQVWLIESEGQFLERLDQIGSKPYVMQQFIANSSGKDIRLQVVGSRVVCSMLRKANNDFRANASAGASLYPYTPSEEEQSIALAAAKSCGAAFAGVDILFGDDGPILCEVNSNAQLINIHRTTGVNVADHIVSYAIQLVKERGGETDA